MKALAKIMAELPRTYKSYRKFIDDNMFGEGEEEVVHPAQKEQREFTKRFNAAIEKEKAR